MRKILLLSLLLFPLFVKAQKGFELRATGGYATVGFDPWVASGLVTGSLLYNFNGVLAIGPALSSGIGAHAFIDSRSNKHETSFSELGALAQLTFLRAGKFKLYGTLSYALVGGETGEITDGSWNNGQTDKISGSNWAPGIGVGALLNLGGGFYFNILDYQVRFVSSEFMKLDRGFEGRVGPLHAFRTGISYAFSAK